LRRLSKATQLKFLSNVIFPPAEVITGLQAKFSPIFLSYIFLLKDRADKKM
jgi:hypothetical protein